MKKQFRDLAIGDRIVHQILPASGDKPAESVLVEVLATPAPTGDSLTYRANTLVISRNTTLIGVGHDFPLTYFPETEVYVVEEQVQRDVVQVTIDIEVLGGVTAEVMQAIEALAGVMLVQAEDGIYTDGMGRKESEGDFLRDIGAGTRVSSVRKVRA